MGDKVLYEVYESKDLKKFKSNINNRNIYKRNVNGILDSLEEKPQIYQPILVTSNMVVLDGHHRLEAVKRYNNSHDKKIGIPYIIINEANSIQVLTILNKTGKKYTVEDFIYLYAKVNDGQCRVIRNMSKELNVSVTEIFNLMTNYADRGRFQKKIEKDEWFGFDNWGKVRDFYSFCDKVSNIIKLNSTNRVFLYTIYCVSGFEENQFIHNAEIYRNKNIGNTDLIRLPAQMHDIKQKYVDIYNYGVRNAAKKMNFTEDGRSLFI